MSDTAEGDTEVHFKYKKDDEYSRYYINGARGYIAGNFDFKMELYSEHKVLPKEESQLVSKDGTITRNIPNEDTVEVVRTIECEISMPFTTLIQMRDFLNRMIEQNFKEEKR